MDEGIIPERRNFLANAEGEMNTKDTIKTTLQTLADAITTPHHGTESSMQPRGN